MPFTQHYTNRKQQHQQLSLTEAMEDNTPAPISIILKTSCAENIPMQQQQYHPHPIQQHPLTCEISDLTPTTLTTIDTPSAPPQGLDSCIQMHKSSCDHASRSAVFCERIQEE